LPDDQSLIEEIKRTLVDDEYAQEVIAKLQTTALPPREQEQIKNFTFEDGLLLHRNLIYLPGETLRVRILQQCHDSLLAGHYGAGKTQELVSRNYW